MKMAGEERTTLHCRCDKRHADEQAGTTRYSAAWGGWVLIDVPARTMSARSRWFASERQTQDGIRYEDHEGEPFVWEVCVHCGGDLPEGEQRTDPTQGDGDGA